MKIGKFAISALLSCSIYLSANAQAVTFQLQGSLGLWSSPSTSDQLNALVGTSFSALLTYDENALPTSVWEPSFTNYADQGNIQITTLAGTAVGDFSNLQTFLYSGGGSNFNGYVGSQGLTQQLSIDQYNLTSIDFQFASAPPAAGLSGFALPSSISLEDFNNNNFVRLSITNGTDTNAFIGTISQVTTVPEPDSYALFLAGLVLLGFVVRHSKLGQTV